MQALSDSGFLALPQSSSLVIGEIVSIHVDDAHLKEWQTRPQLPRSDRPHGRHPVHPHHAALRHGASKGRISPPPTNRRSARTSLQAAKRIVRPWRAAIATPSREAAKECRPRRKPRDTSSKIRKPRRGVRQIKQNPSGIGPRAPVPDQAHRIRQKSTALM